jgi:hypothetical protein
MAISLLYGCAQIETGVRDMDAAASFMKQVLGGGDIEQVMARQIEGLFPQGGFRIEHFDCGEGMFQVNAPTPAARFGDNTSVHQRYLDAIGPCVADLNYYVDDIAHAHELLTGMGAATLIQGPSTLIDCLADYGDNTRPGGDERNFYFLGSRALIGLDLELMEPNFRRFTGQVVQYPCFVQPRPAVGDGNLKLRRLRLVVADLEATHANLVRLFAPASRSQPYDRREGRLARSFRIGLGGLELEYCQPLAGGGLAEALARYGPGVTTVEFAAAHAERVLTRARAAGLEVFEEPDLIGDGRDPRPRIASRELVGFDVVLDP